MSAPESESGLAQMDIDGRLVTSDTSRFNTTDGRSVVRVHFDGCITVGPVEHDGVPTWHGVRSAWEPWTPSGRGLVTVLGVVVDERPT